MTSVKFAKEKSKLLAEQESENVSSTESVQSVPTESFIADEHELEAREENDEEYDQEEEEEEAPSSLHMPDVMSDKRLSIIDSDYGKKYKRKFRSDLDDEHDDDRSSEDDSQQDASLEYIHQEELEEVPDFFAELGTVPDLDDISLSPFVSEISHKSSETKIEEQTLDVGRFYDPMTGELVKSSSSETETHIEEESLHYGEEDEKVEEEEDDFLLLPFEMDDEAELVQELTQQKEKQEGFFDEDEMAALKQIKIVEEIDYEEWQRLETARQVLYNTHEFLHQIIENVVQYCEEDTPIILLRQNLDKIKLMQLLSDKLGEIDSEQRVRFFLNRKAVEHFRRKKHFRAISQDNPDTVTQDMKKLSKATARLDQLLGKQEELSRVYDLTATELERKKIMMNDKSSAAIDDFENLVRNTLYHENFVRMNASVNYHLGRIHKTRMEISKVRYRLISKQHTLANLMDKLEQMEQLGGGLRMRDFEHLNAETQGLGRKIEDRNAEWNKLILRRSSDLHIMAHLKERQTMLSQTIALQEIALQELCDEKQDVRQNLYDLKIDRDRIRHEIRELSFQGGLLDKPALMQDYDETLERLNKMRDQVERSQEKHTAITKRIQALELKNETSDYDL